MNSRDLFAELKRRNVCKVGIAYAVVAWLLMQVASQIFPFFEIPNWAVRLVVLLLVIGFPVALILAWAFELTPEGIKRAKDVDLCKPIPARGGKLTTTVSQATGQKSPLSTSATHWSVVLNAQSELRTARQALEKLCRTYWRPIYSFVQRQGIGPKEARDLTQGFLALLLERRDLNTVRKEKSRLRSYLLLSLKNFLADEGRRAIAIKRGKRERLIPLEEIRADERINGKRNDIATADQMYERRWALTVLEQVIARLRDEYRTAENPRLFGQMKKMLMDESGPPSQAEVARELGITENALKRIFRRFCQRYQSLLREEISHTLMVPGDVEDELHHLIGVVQG